MKKLFFLAATLVAALTINAEVIYDWAGGVAANQVGSTTVKQESGDGSIDLASKITINSVQTPAIKFGKGFSSGDPAKFNYLIIKPAEGGFKANDVLKFKAVVNTDDASKYAALRVRVDDNTELYTSENVVNINGNATAVPTEMSYKLAADADELHVGRYGNTGLFVVALSVERGGGTAIDNTEAEVKAVKTFENGQLIIIKNGVKYNATGAVIE